MLANRSKDSLPSTVSSSQSAFIAGRSITDYELLAQELVRHTEEQLLTLLSCQDQSSNALIRSIRGLLQWNWEVRIMYTYKAIELLMLQPIRQLTSPSDFMFTTIDQMRYCRFFRIMWKVWLFQALL
ncbi:hypothetical protein GOBAR_AA35142 [Gossypium barbadense]|uniref:Uncharacterized protein n=1 Tax=Gossypium barbadense TaxID=3634 RepID=A0A2P5W365_GOSBA|nr:hypothetical protein GOBAR_AA35142 [Gossypium barbadense]